MKQWPAKNDVKNEATLQDTNDCAVALCVNQRNLAPALLTASRIARQSKTKDFDIVIASLTPLPIPDEFQDLGVHNVVLGISDDLRSVGIKQPWPAAAYLRLWLAREFSETYRRILYLDADIYPQAADYRRLMNADIGAYACAVVLDKEQWLNPDDPILDLARYRSKSTNYFNSGVMLIDVAQYNRQGLLQQLLDRYRAGIDSPFKDQSVLNLVLEDNFAQLSPVWNWQWTHRYPMLTKLTRPFLLHLSGLPKPWTSHESATRFSSALIEEYKAFFAAQDAPLTFETTRRGGLRESLRDQVTNLGGHLDVWGRYRRQMRKFPDPDTALF